MSVSRRSVLAGATAALLAPRAAAAAQRVSVAVGAEHSIIYLPWDLAKALGYFEREGLDVSLTYLRSGSEAATALASGSSDFAACGVDHAIAAQLRGKYLPLVIQFMRVPAAAVLVRPADRAKIASFRDLRGKSVGVTSLGAGSHVIALWLAKVAGLGRDDIRILAVGSGPTAAAALEGGRVDAIVAYDPLVTSAVNSGKAAYLYDLYQPEVARRAMDLPSYAFSGTLVREETVAQSPQTVQRAVNALVRAMKYMHARPPEDVAKALDDEQRGGLSAEEWLRSYVHAKAAFTDYGQVRVDGVRGTVFSNLYELGQEGTAINYSRLFDLRFVETANRSVKA